MLTDNIIQAKAKQLLEETGLGDTYPLPIEIIVEYLGFQCHFYIPDKDIEDISSAVSHTKKKIYINQNNTNEQQLFSIAHKVGHIVLHGDNHDYIDSPNFNNNSKGEEAELFAMELLMPEEIFHLKWNQTNQNYKKLANFFGVNEVNIKKRAMHIGLISNMVY